MSIEFVTYVPLNVPRVLPHHLLPDPAALHKCFEFEVSALTLLQAKRRKGSPIPGEWSQSWHQTAATGRLLCRLIRAADSLS